MAVQSQISASKTSDRRLPRQRRLGIEITDRFVRFLELEGPVGEMTVFKSGQKALPFGAMVSGSVKNARQIEAVLHSISRECFFAEPHIVLGVPTKIKLAPLDEHAPPKKDQKKFLVNEARTIVGTRDGAAAISSAQSVVSFESCPTRPIRDVREIVKSLGAKSPLFISPAHALIAALGRSGPFIIVDIGKQHSKIVAGTESLLLAEKTFLFGGDDITATIKRSGEYSFEEAESMKKEQGIILEILKQKPRDILPHLSPLIAAITELEAVIKNNFPDALDSHIVLTGETAMLPGLAEYLISETGLPTRIANIWQKAFSFDDYIPQIDFSSSLSFASCVGALLAGESNAFIFLD